MWLIVVIQLDANNALYSPHCSYKITAKTSDAFRISQGRGGFKNWSGIANKLNDYRRLQFVAREVLIRKEPSVSTGASSEDVYGHMIFNLLFPNFRVMVLMFG